MLLNNEWVNQEIKEEIRKYMETNENKNTTVQKLGDAAKVFHCWWECNLVQSLWKTVWRFLKKLKIDLPYDPAIALLGIYPRDTGVLMHRGTCTPMFIAALSTSQIMERA